LIGCVSFVGGLTFWLSKFSKLACSLVAKFLVSWVYKIISASLAKSFFGYVGFLKHFVLVRLCFVFASPAFLFVCVFLVVAEIKVSCNNLVNLFASRSFTVGESGVHKMRLTKRAADWWDSSRLTNIFLASGFFCSRSESRLAHQRLTQTVGLLVE